MSFRSFKYLEDHKNYYGCSGNLLRIDNEKNILAISKQRFYCTKETTITAKELFKKTNIIQSPGAVYRKIDIDEIGGYNEHMGIEDLYIFLRAAAHGKKMAILPRIFAFYRIHSSNTHSKYKWMHDEKMKILLDYKGTRYYNDLKRLFFLEGFYSLSKKNKLDSMRLLNKVFYCIDNKYLYAGMFNLIFRW